jgi:hypothetical protein
MNRVATLFYVSLAIATAAISVGFGQIQFPMGVIVTIIIGVIWASRHWRFSFWSPHFVFVLFIVVTVSGVMLGMSGFFLLLAVTFSLICWDVDCFLTRIQQVDRVLDDNKIVMKYLMRLGIVVLIWFVLGVVALNMNFEFRFIWVLLLGLLLLFGLSGAIGYLRRPTQ